MREKIKLAATDLITRRGYHAVTFREIAEAVNTTRANMHYHFGNKDQLIEEVLEDYVAETVDFYRSTFTNGQMSLREKVLKIRDFLHGRYKRFNSDGLSSDPWSLPSRLRSDWEALSPKMKAILRNFTAENETCIRIGVALAVSSGELREDTPQEQVSLLIGINILYAQNVTRDTQSFEGVTHLWEATLSAIEAAYGTPRPDNAAVGDRVRSAP